MFDLNIFSRKWWTWGHIIDLVGLVCAPVAQVRHAYTLVERAFDVVNTGDLHALATVFRLEAQKDAALVAEISGILFQSKDTKDAIRRLSTLAPAEFKPYVAMFKASLEFDTSDTHARQFYEELATLDKYHSDALEAEGLTAMDPKALTLLGYVRPVAKVVQGSIDVPDWKDIFYFGQLVPLDNAPRFTNPVMQRTPKAYFLYDGVVYEGAKSMVPRMQYAWECFSTLEEATRFFDSDDKKLFTESEWYTAEREAKWQALKDWQRAESDKVRKTTFSAPTPWQPDSYNIYARRNYGPYMYVHCGMEPESILRCFNGVEDRGFIEAINYSAAVSRANAPLGVLSLRPQDLWPYPGYYSYIHKNFYGS